MAQGAAEKDAIRTRIEQRAREMRLTWADISRHLGKNEAYMWQYAEKGTPRELPEEVRYKLADLLDMPEEELRPPRFTASRGPQPRSQQSSDTIPVFAQGEEIDVSNAKERTPRPPNIGADDTEAFGLWIRGRRGRLEPGDLAIIRGHQPPRVGDQVVAVAGRNIAAVGRLLDLTEAAASIEASGGKPMQVDLRDARLMKVAVIVPP
jgi:hypothetical protein